MKRVLSLFPTIGNRPLSITAYKFSAALSDKKTEENVKPEGWYDAKPYASIPGPRKLPLLGNTWRFFPLIGEFHNRDYVYITTALFERYGKIAQLSGLPAPDLVMLFAPEDIEYLFRNEGIYPIRESTTKSFAYYRKNVRPEVFQGCASVADVQGKAWQDTRTKLNPIAMHPQTVLQYVGSMDKIAGQLVRKMRHAANSDPKREMPKDFNMFLYSWTLESIMLVCLDKQLGCLDLNLPMDSEPTKIINSVIEMFRLFHTIERSPTLTNLYQSDTWKRYVEVMDFIIFTFLKHLEEAVSRFDKMDESDSQSTSKTILQQLLKIDKKLAITTAMDFLTAGVDTTGKVAGSCLYFLARNTKAQNTLREELYKLLPEKDSPITKEVLSKATYLKAVIKEATRLAPIASGNMRQTVKDMVIRGYQIPKGTNVFTGNLILSRIDENYQQAKDFVPERYLRTTTGNLSFKSANPFVTLPFGFGPRSCVGRRLASLELEIGISKIIRNFYLEWHYGDVTFRSNPFYGITDPLRLRVHETEH